MTYFETSQREAVSDCVLSQEDWDSFNASLDEPPAPTEKLKALLARVPVWDQPIGPSNPNGNKARNSGEE